MNFSELGRALWRRKVVLIACVVLGILAAVPFALKGPNSFSSSTRVYIPPTNPLPGSTGAASTSSGSLVNVLLEDYVGGRLRADIKEEIADPDALRTVTVDQSPDLASYTITVAATDADVAQEGAEVGGRLLIAASGRISTSLIRRLSRELEVSLAPLTDDIAQLQEELDTLRAEVEVEEGDQVQLRIRLNSLSQSADRAEAAGDDQQAASFRAQAEEVEEDLQSSIERETGLQRKLAAAQAKATIAQTRSAALGNVVTQAEANRAARLAGSAVIDDPSEPSTGSIVSMLLTIVLAAVAATVVGALLVLFLDRKAVFGGRTATPSHEGVV